MKLERRDTWPSLCITVELLPWAWRFRWYRDDIEHRCWRIDFGPISLHCIANTPLFAVAPARSGEQSE